MKKVRTKRGRENEEERANQACPMVNLWNLNMSKTLGEGRKGGGGGSLKIKGGERMEWKERKPDVGNGTSKQVRPLVHASSNKKPTVGTTVDGNLGGTVL